MPIPRPRAPIALFLSIAVLLTAVAPVAANDPTPTTPPVPEAEQPGGGRPSVHAEMLSEHETRNMAFPAGDRPASIAAPTVQGGTVTVEGGAGGVAALPNGLSHEVFGYLPYWSLTGGHLAELDYRLVSSIAYFSVGALPNGTLDKVRNGVATSGWSGWNSAAMTNVISAAHARGVRVVLTVTMMAWDGNYRPLTTLLSSQTNRNRLARQIAAAVKARNADGVNLDFEPMPNSLESHYTRFVRNVKSELVAQGAGSYLTVATTGGAASWDEGYELVDNADANPVGLLSPGGADAIMVMGYDFNWSGSARAGGVAPIDSPYTLDVRSAMAAYRRLVPGSKLIWGVPYYGRAWTTTTSTRNSPTCSSTPSTCQPYSSAFTYSAARDAVADHGRLWDDRGLVPWYRYRSTTYDTWVQAYYDDAASLAVKYDLAKANTMRGIGIWHLLMDGSRPELWDTLADEFGPAPFSDITGSRFRSAITWLYRQDIMGGCKATRFCPKAYLTRGQLASALANGLRLPPPAADHYDDDDGSRYEDDINRLTDAGFTRGCGGGDYCPNQVVRRGQLATAIAWALELPPSTEDHFTDDDGNRHEENINRIADAGITSGCGDGRFCHNYRIKRAQAAAFLRNAFDR